MVEDKCIGLAPVSSLVAIGTSFIITKKGLNDAANKLTYGRSASDIANFAAYTFAPAILVTPLGALSVIIGAVLASLLLNKKLGHLGRLGCTLCLLGSLIIVLHAPSDKEGIDSVEVFLSYVYGRKNQLVYISICSLVRSISVMAIKGFGIAVKLTFSGNNQFTHFTTYIFDVTVAGCILVQMNYFNKALGTFSTNVVNPTYYVGFSTAALIASIILFQCFNTFDTASAVSLLTGFVGTLFNAFDEHEPGHPSMWGCGIYAKIRGRGIWRSSMMSGVG
ncbi:magnesium transporter [Ephemerocybe angulata]|uniref:Magnesium transporter n=1 Tax=Ephemerocybe angulata TaxID=980116 RepID=A0A8H6M6M6_9AGAR|nr:magnesium transporter [Tulosesus angulatus]